MITSKKFARVLRKAGLVGLAVLMLLTSGTVVQAQTPAPPTRDRLKQMAG